MWMTMVPAASWAQVRPACWRDVLQLRLCLTMGWMDGSCLDPQRKAIARAGARSLLFETRTGQTPVREELEPAMATVET